jgi:hypothetical protein
MENTTIDRLRVQSTDTDEMQTKLHSEPQQIPSILLNIPCDLDQPIVPREIIVQ